jgi:hypothetical protein
LCVLAIKGKPPTEENVLAQLDSSANCTWKGFRGSTMSYPYIATVQGNESPLHYVIVHSPSTSGGNDVWDPNGGRPGKLSNYRRPPNARNYYKSPES